MVNLFVNGLALLAFLVLGLLMRRQGIPVWKTFGFCIAISCLALMTFDQVLFALGAETVCHYTPFGEWIIELPATAFGLCYMFKYMWDEI